MNKLMPLLLMFLFAMTMAFEGSCSKVSKVQKFQSLKMGKFDYYGKVIDQHGEPVVGATVKVDIGYYPFIPNGDFTPSSRVKNLVTDAEGRFSIVGEKGESVRVESIQKGGYEVNKAKMGRITFSRVGIEGLKKVGNPDKPVIFHAWKKTEAEALYHGERYIQKYSKAGVYKAINIPMMGGAMSVKFDLDPNGEPYKPENWSISLKVKDGGFIESNNEIFMNIAPDTGYEPVWSKEYVKGVKGFKDEDRKKFFFRSGNNYGRMEVNYVAYYNKEYAGILRIKYWLNPNGSRNLQYDPAKRIYPKGN